ncbi:hypothetical protein FX983_06357 [Pseudomonas frederiksbergensis]|uniref:Uncharacterized protein n=1 Tax=Pseudomonas frederiksbergensis TaxID=104087 RepID=A0A6L5BVM6_9PSED|nr:hypothetical protein FX983_06357 [Pseudomonas frederiksbergensis]
MEKCMAIMLILSSRIKRAADERQRHKGLREVRKIVQAFAGICWHSRWSFHGL